MDLLVIVFFIIVIIVFILTFGILFFVSGVGKIIDFISYLAFRNREDCPFCHFKNSMIAVRTDNGYKKVCKRCGFSIEVEDKENN